MSESYSTFAKVYDELMDAVPYREWCDRIVRYIHAYGVSKHRSDAEKALPGENFLKEEDPEISKELQEEILASERDLVLDLGCGTGTLTEMLYQAGYDMIGIDGSQEMLAGALEKKDRTGSEILYLQQDMRELSLYSTVGTVVSVCDCVNYLLEIKELEQVFSLVNNYLYPGGIFLFDFNTDYKYREVIGDAVIAENREDCSFIWENFYDDETRINEYDLTLFLRREDALYEKVEETHYQRGYTPEEIRAALAKAGMELVLMCDADTDQEVSGESERVIVVAREHGKAAPQDAQDLGDR